MERFFLFVMNYTKKEAKLNHQHLISFFYKLLVVSNRRLIPFLTFL